MDIRITCSHTASLCVTVSPTEIYAAGRQSTYKFEAGATVNHFGEQPMRWLNNLQNTGETVRSHNLSVPDDDESVYNEVQNYLPHPPLPVQRLLRLHHVATCITKTTQVR